MLNLRQHKLTWIVVIKIFAINLYHHSHFLAAPFISQLFSRWPFLNRATPLFTASMFLSGNILASLGISTKFTWIVVVNFFAINLYHHSHFLAAPFDFTTFSHWLFLKRATPILQPGCFWVDITSFCKFYNLSCFSLLQEKESMQADVEIATTLIAYNCIQILSHVFLE